MTRSIAMAAKSSLVSGMGVAMSVLQTLVEKVRKAGGRDEDIHHLTTPEADDVWEKIAKIIAEEGNNVRKIFSIMVDYDRSVYDSIMAGCYFGWDNIITEERFPREEWEKGKKEVAMRVFWFNQSLETKKAIQKMEEEEYRPATLRELLAFGETNPELQTRFRIVSLKSFWANHTFHGMVVLGNLGRIRHLNTECDGHYRGTHMSLDHSFEIADPAGECEWDDSCRFLGVKTDSK
jgi:hypothetical protein